MQIPIRIRDKTEKIKEIINEKLSKNILSATQIIDEFCPILLRKDGVSIVDTEKLQKIQQTTTPKARRNKIMFIHKKSTTAPTEICLGAEAQPQSSLSANNKQNREPEKVAMKQNRQANTRQAITSLVQKQTEVFAIINSGNPDTSKIHRYEWHLILNHAEPTKLRHWHETDEYTITGWTK